MQGPLGRSLSPSPRGGEGTSGTLGSSNCGVMEDSTQGVSVAKRGCRVPSSFWASQPCFPEGNREL